MDKSFSIQPNNGTVEVHPAIIGLKGGKKQHWLRINRQIVLDYYHEHGPEKTMQRFNFRRKATFDGFLFSKAVNYDKLTIADRALMKAEVAIGGYRDSKHRLNELEARLDDIEPLAKVGYSILAAMKRAMPDIEASQRVRPDPLKLADFGKSRKNEVEEAKLYVMSPEEDD